MKLLSSRSLGLVTGCCLALATAAFAQSNAGVSVTCDNGMATVTYKGKQVWSGKARGTPVSRSSNINGTEYVAVLNGDQVLWENVPGAAGKIGGGGTGGSVGGGAGGIDVQKFMEEHQRNFEEQKRAMEKQQQDFLKQHGNLNNGTGGRSGGFSGGKSGGSSGGSSGGGSGGFSRGSSGGSSGGSSKSSAGGGGSASSQNFTLSAGPDATIQRANGKTTLTWKGKAVDLGQTSGRISFKASQEDNGTALTVMEDDRVLWESSSGKSKSAK